MIRFDLLSNMPIQKEVEEVIATMCISYLKLDQSGTILYHKYQELVNYAKKHGILVGPVL